MRFGSISTPVSSVHGVLGVYVAYYLAEGLLDCREEPEGVKTAAYKQAVLEQFPGFSLMALSVSDFGVYTSSACL
jgi:hypothetical protein